ncbi:MAG: glycoside-pentoside-hexuronide (GPH):cation symporter [Treponema sp.]|jgi:probable glucitol transport protein GutA|nr:glycoside-pentoside-hexuronide (GPH):cation symporter [Treponema sp.]
MAGERIVWQTTQKERVLYYGFSFGQIIFYTTMVSFLQIFLTDIGITAAAVGIILLVARVWDAVNDPMFGVIVAKSSLKGGKYKPWLKISPVLIFGFTVLLFALPAGSTGSGAAFSPAIKTALAAVLYICWGMSYTICDVPYFSVVSVMTSQVAERNSVIGRGRLFTMIGAALVTVVMPLLYPSWGWFPAAALMAAAAFLFMFPLGFAAKERIHNADSQEKAPALGEIVRAVGKNRYLLILCAAILVTNITNTTSTIAGYFAIHCLGGPQRIPLITTVPLLVSVLFTAFAPAIIRRVDKFRVYLICFAVAFVTCFGIFFTGYSNLAVFVILSILRTTSLMFIGTFIILFIVDCAEYGRYKTGEDITAVSVSLQTFTVKAISAMSAALGMFVLGLSGFIDGAGAVQPPEVINALFILISIVPAAGVSGGFLILFFGYKLRDNYVQVMAKVNNGELGREEAQAQLPKIFS